MRAAMNMVKAQLGRDAVILSSRELPSGSVEIRAATDFEPEPRPLKSKLVTPIAKPVEDGWFLPDPELINGVFTELQEMRHELARLRAERTVGTQANRQWDQLMQELKELGRVLGASSVEPGDAGDAVLSRLLAGGVELALARSLVESVAGLQTGQRERTALLATSMQQAFDPAPPVWARDKHTVAAFVGPTGVGKTTTLAKIAAHASLNQGMKVALVAADTYRISGVHQVQTYAELLGLPVAVARNRAELQQACRRFSDKDLVLVDTTGRNPWSRDGLAKTDELLGGSTLERHLCVAASTPGGDMARIVDRYSTSGIRSLVITKMDEARTVGGVLSSVWDNDFQIAHVTTGQSVPGDIERPDPARLCQAVLG